ncbi:MAG: shikimate kinase [Frankiaceae bacterium]|jgi:shikimate kinase|nr:shikimate kinase [Frankiaceae bacterium]
MTPGPRVLLIGMMGAGKSTVGTALSARTGWPYYDNDELVVRATGKPTPNVLDDSGVAALRAVESLALQQALSLDSPLIGGIAGGVVDETDDRERLRESDAVIVWLRARIETLIERVGDGAGRPWLQPDPAAAMRKLYAGRAPRYAAIASLIVDVDDLPPTVVAERIMGFLSGDLNRPR